MENTLMVQLKTIRHKSNELETIEPEILEFLDKVETMIKRRTATIEIEKPNGSTRMSFQITDRGDDEMHVFDEDNCSLADIDGDYIYDTENLLYRIQEN